MYEGGWGRREVQKAEGVGKVWEKEGKEAREGTRKSTSPHPPSHRSVVAAGADDTAAGELALRMQGNTCLRVLW